MRELAAFYDPEEAFIAAGCMRAYGYDIALADENMLMVSPTHRIALGGFRMMIAAHLHEEAQEVLATIRHQPNHPSSPCPVCEGVDYRRVKSWWFPAIFFFFFGAAVPFATNSNYLECRQCKTRVTRDYIDGSENR